MRIRVFEMLDAPSRRPGVGYLLLALGVGLVALAGYGGYVLHPRFDLPAVEGAALLGMAAAAGLGSFFSPCSFPRAARNRVTPL